MVSTEQTPIVPTQPIPAKSLVIKTDKPRPYVCATCTRSFARLEHLKRHERSHTKEKPFQCPVCERSFARRDLLLRHKQKLHANFSPSDTKRNSISGPCALGRRSSTMSASFSPAFSPSFSPQANANSLNPLEHELMGTQPPVSFSRSQSFSAVSADSYMPDSAGYHNDFEDTINPQMLRQGSISAAAHQPPQAVPFQQPVHMGVRRNRRFNSNASAKPFVDSPDYSIASSLSQFDSPNTVPYQSPPTEFSQGTPLAQQHHWAGDLGTQGLSQLGMAGFEHNDDFVDSLLNLDDRFEIKTEQNDLAPHEMSAHGLDTNSWVNLDASPATQDPIRGFSSSFTSSLLKTEEHWPPQQPHQFQQPPAASPLDHQSPFGAPHHSPHLHMHQQQQQRQQHHLHEGEMQPPPPPPPPAGLPLEQPTLAPQAAPSIGLQNLPSSQEVRRLVAAFYSNFNTPAHFVQHSPDLASQNMALVMSMAALGALYLNELQTASQIFDLSCDCIRMFSDLNNISINSESEPPKDVPIWLVQASMLSLYYLMYTASSANYDRILAQASNLANLAQRARLNLKPSEVMDVPSANASVEEKYKYFVASERRVRTMYAVFIATSYCSICLDTPVYCDISVLECGTPRADSLVAADSAEKWWSNTKVRKLGTDTEPFSKYMNSIQDGEVLDSTIAPTVLLSLVCGLIKQFGQDQHTHPEQKEKIVHTWESSWSNSIYSSSSTSASSKDERNNAILSDCAPIASLAMMRIRITPPIHLHTCRADYQSLNAELDAMRLSHPEDLVDAAVYALDAFVTIDEMNRKKSKLFFPAIIYLVEGGIILSEALAIIEAMAQPLEKHQRLLMRAHKILSQIAESETYAFASDALFNIQNPQTSLSSMVLRVAIALFQCNSPVPPLALDVFRARLGA